MKLEEEIVNYIFNVVKTADIIGIESIIIEPEMVRSMNDSRTVGLWTDKDVPDMPFGSIGITRLHDLKTRFSIIEDLKEFNIEVTPDDNGEYAKQLVLSSKASGKRLKIDYRCGDPRRITAPKVLNDIDCFGVQLTPDAVSLYQKGLTAMGATDVSIVSNDGVSFVFSDIANDIYNHTFADTVELIPNSEGEVESSTKFAHRYPAKTLLSLFKNNQEAKFTVCKRGMIKFPLNELTVFVLPKV